MTKKGLKKKEKREKTKEKRKNQKKEDRGERMEMCRKREWKMEEKGRGEEEGGMSGWRRVKKRMEKRKV